MHEASEQRALDDSSAQNDDRCLVSALTFPCTLKEIARVLEISYDTLRNKWINRIEAAHEGLACPSIRNSSRKVTSYGFEAIQLWVELQHSKEAYQAAIQAKYPCTVTMMPSESDEPSIPHLALVEHPVPTDFTRGHITPVTQTVAAHPLAPVEFADMAYDTPHADTHALDAQTLQARGISANGAVAIQHFLAADLQARLVTAMRQNEHLVATAQAGAIAAGVDSLGKPSAEADDHPASA